jgi:hypothetical protein
MRMRATSAAKIGNISGWMVLRISTGTRRHSTDLFFRGQKLSTSSEVSFVVIFLHMLEYYKGILILTSNRIRTFNEAFKS